MCAHIKHVLYVTVNHLHSESRRCCISYQAKVRETGRGDRPTDINRHEVTPLGPYLV